MSYTLHIFPRMQMSFKNVHGKTCDCDCDCDWQTHIAYDLQYLLVIPGAPKNRHCTCTYSRSDIVDYFNNGSFWYPLRIYGHGVFITIRENNKGIPCVMARRYNSERVVYLPWLQDVNILDFMVDEAVPKLVSSLQRRPGDR